MQGSRWLALLAIPVMVQAGEERRLPEGVTLPEQVVVDGRRLVLNGVGTHDATIFRFPVYGAGLYLERPSSSPHEIIMSKQTRRLELHFVRAVSREEMVVGWRSGLQKNAPELLPELEDRLALLERWTPGMQPGDILRLTYVPGDGVTVEVTGRVRGTIPGEDFARALWSIWLGRHPPSLRLKAELLGWHFGWH